MIPLVIYEGFLKGGILNLKYPSISHRETPMSRLYPSPAEMRKERIDNLLKLAREKNLTQKREIDDLIRRIYPYIGYVTRTDYRQVIEILLTNGEDRA